MVDRVWAKDKLVPAHTGLRPSRAGRYKGPDYPEVVIAHHFFSRCWLGVGLDFMGGHVGRFGIL